MKAKATAATKKPKRPAPTVPVPGDVIAIPLPNKWWGAICMLGVDVLSARTTAWRFYIVDGFWDALPTAVQVAKHEPMKSRYGVRLPGYPDVWRGWIQSPFPKDFVVVGTTSLDTERQSWNGDMGVMVFAKAERFRAELLDVWRERFDSKALAAERAKAQAEYEATQAREEAERIANNTLARMLKERPFAHWREHWGQTVVRVVTEAFTKATKELIKLERTRGTAAKKAVFVRLVEELNAIEDRHGCIETGEREEVVARIEEMARLVKLDNKDEKLTGSRDW